MRKGIFYIIPGVLIFIVSGFIPANFVFGQRFGFGSPTSGDTSEIKFPVKTNSNYPYEEDQESPLYLKTPSNIEEKVEYDPESNEYVISRKAGNLDISRPVTMSIQEYNEYEHKKALKEYWQQRSRGQNYDSRSSFIPNITIGGEGFDKVFGSNTINITPQGSAELIFGYNLSRVDNPQVSERLRKTPSFTFEEKIQMNVTGTIGDKMELGINYNTEATFDFENKQKLEYSGKEDEIIKKIEAGNITLPLTGSLITGSQSLFGLKTELQFGKLYMTTVFSQQKGETSVIEMEGGAQLNEFEIAVIDYDANRHFFLSQYFRDRYEEALKNLPVINSSITITKIEVWVTNKINATENTRDILAVTDLGEPREFTYNAQIKALTSNTYPCTNKNNNGAYNLLNNESGIRNKNTLNDAINGLGIDSFALGKDYEKLYQARLLTSKDYKIHPNLGYISLNTALNSDEILAVAYEFTLNGTTYKVGDLSIDQTDQNKILFVKLLKGTSLSPKYRPTWDLMMKNVYALGAYQLNAEDFELNILYQDDKTGTAIPYLKEGKIANKLLLREMDLDRVNSQGDVGPDGLFDFYEGVTIYSSNGRIFFPTTQPFGDFLRKKITGENADYEAKYESVADKYVFDELYDESQTVARQKAEKNKFLISGKYKSSSSNEIMLNAMNIPEGSVNVTAGGQKLTEGQDYTVDYTLGRVKIINQGLLESGVPIKVSLESNSLFNIQTKTMVGTNLNYKFSDDFIIGGTILRLTERPLTKKVNIGEEPISNTIWGLNGSYNTQSQFLTTMIDKLPLIETKETSSISIDGEFAQLIPGQSKTIGKNGIAYIDDFEGTETSIEMKTYHSWKLASTPQGQTLFPEAESTGWDNGYNRAKLAWYSIDPLFLRDASTTPSYIRGNDELQMGHYVREVYEEEIFPEKDRRRDEPPTITVLNLAFYPDEVGPYNFVVDGDSSGRISGIDQNGKLEDPETRWGGIMRSINTSDFEEANVEFIEFWLMDPFVENPDHKGGKLYFNLGDISEDILRDSRQSFENGLPGNDSTTGVTTTPWARIPNQKDFSKSFYEDEKRAYQDVGLDGARNEVETTLFQQYVEELRQKRINYYNEIMDEQKGKRKGDFAHDDYHYFRGTDYDDMELDILERYKDYNNPDKNTPTDELNEEDYPTTGTYKPDNEDINEDNTLNESENYYQYIVELSPETMNNSHPYIANIRQSDVEDQNSRTVNWYQFRIPIKEFDEQIGSIDGFKSIRFMRIFMQGWSEPVVLRFARLELVRSEWRKYELSLAEPGDALTDERADTKFDVASVNIEEHTEKYPVSYVLPPGIDRAIDPTNPLLQELNEQAIVLQTSDLGDGDGRAVYKTLNMDMRQYTKLKMNVHAEAIPGISLNNYELTAFIRLGTDYTSNYYEYQIPLKLTPPGDYFVDGQESDEIREIVWPDENFFNFELSEFQEVKQKRNEALRKDPTLNLTTPFTYIVDMEDEYEDRMITVVGNPTLSDVKVIMIGIKNPGNYGLQNENNDGESKSVEVWMNELRLTDFKDDGGWAANARMQTRLADLGTFNLAGSVLTPGFGSIEKKVNERAKEEVIQYDVSTNIQLGKFFPEKAKVNIPMYVGYSEQIINPQYDPLDKDIALEDVLANYKDDKDAIDSIKYYSQDRTSRKSINFTNVKVNRQSKKPKPWDPANFSVSYAFNEVEKRDVETEYDWEYTHRGTFNYLYNLRPKNVQPLSKVKALNNQYLKIIKDFNFYYLPSKISYRTDVSRQYNEIKKRNLSLVDDSYAPEIEATAERNFLWNWYFDLKYDLSRSLKFDYSATNMARFDEIDDFMLRDSKDESEYDSLYNNWKNDLWRNVKDFGRNTNFNHKINAQYTVPINKLPLLDWTSLSARYSGTYDWIAGPKYYDENDIEDYHLGNTIKNTNSIQLSSNNNLVNLYNKVGFLKKINQEAGKPKKPGEKQMKKVSYEAEDVNLYANRGKTIEHRLKTEKVKIKVLDQDGNEVTVNSDIVDQNKIRITADRDIKKTKVFVEGEVEKRENPFVFIMINGTRALMAVRDISISYTENHATTVPGFKETHSYSTFTQKPGWAYIAGWHEFENNIKYAINNEDWLIDNLDPVSTPITWSASKNLNLRSNVEPFNGFRIDLSGSWNESQNIDYYYDPASTWQYFNDSMMVATGNVSISTINLRTTSLYNADIDTINFEIFKNYRMAVSERLSEEYYRQHQAYPHDTVEDGYPDGYGPTSQQVLIPAFFAAYTGQDVQNVSLNPLPTKWQLLPNWRITYDGLSKIEYLKKYFRSINLNHSYRSTYSIASYRKNPYYVQGEDIYNSQGDLLSEYEISSVSISEQFSPLISIDMNWVNSLTSRFEIKKSRNLNLSLSNNQLSEITSEETVVGLGYRFKDVELFINQKTYKSDVNVRGDLSIRDNSNRIRSIAIEEEEEINGQPVSGQRVITVKLSADYVLNNNFNLRFFFDRVVNKPIVYRTFPTANTNVGLSITFNLTQ